MTGDKLLEELMCVTTSLFFERLFKGIDSAVIYTKTTVSLSL